MTDLKYSIDIQAKREAVWNALTDTELYPQWAKAFSDGSRFVGIWEQGKTIDFIDPELGGTRAVLEEVDPPARIHARHIALIQADGTIHTEGDEAEKWIDTIEAYTLIDNGQTTHLIVDIRAHEDFAEMFNSSWAQALPLLKKVSERSVL